MYFNVEFNATSLSALKLYTYVIDFSKITFYIIQHISPNTLHKNTGPLNFQYIFSTVKK